MFDYVVVSCDVDIVAGVGVVVYAVVGIVCGVSGVDVVCVGVGIMCVRVVSNTGVVVVVTCSICGVTMVVAMCVVIISNVTNDNSTHNAIYIGSRGIHSNNNVNTNVDNTNINNDNKCDNNNNDDGSTTHSSNNIKCTNKIKQHRHCMWCYVYYGVIDCSRGVVTVVVVCDVDDVGVVIVGDDVCVCISVVVGVLVYTMLMLLMLSMHVSGCI